MMLGISFMVARMSPVPQPKDMVAFGEKGRDVEEEVWKGWGGVGGLWWGGFMRSRLSLAVVLIGGERLKADLIISL
jgi:hypothetical protein